MVSRWAKRTWFGCGIAAAFTLALATIVFAPKAWAQDKERETVVLAGIRPLKADGDVDLMRIAEAQELRAVAKNVIPLISGVKVLSHAEAISVLGNPYLVSLFECGDNFKCAAQIMGKMRTRGASKMLVGSYMTADDGAKAIQLSLVNLDDGTEIGSVRFKLSRQDALSATAWGEAVAPLFASNGTLVVLTNVDDFECSLDGEPCVISQEDNALRVAPGDHVITLSKLEHVPATLSFRIAAGQTLKASLPLQSIIPQRAPSYLDTNVKDAKERVEVFGKIRIEVIVDPVDKGERFDINVPPKELVPRQWHLSFLESQAYVGVNFSPQEISKNWAAGGLFLVGRFGPRGRLTMNIAELDLRNEKMGIGVRVGRMSGPVLAFLSPATPASWAGELDYSMNGIQLSKELGSIQTAVMVGKPTGRFEPVNVQDGQATGLVPIIEGRIAYLDKERMVSVYGRKSRQYPLMVSVSGAYGIGEAGNGEAGAVADLYPGSAEPLIEPVPFHLVAVELLLPIGPSALAASGTFAHGGIHHPTGEGMGQMDRLDLATGKHRPMDSFGGYVQWSLHLGDHYEVALLGGAEWVPKASLDKGVDPFGSPEATFNSLLAGIVAVRVGGLEVEAQLKFSTTKYLDYGTESTLGGMLVPIYRF